MDFNDINYLYELEKHLNLECNKTQEGLTINEVMPKTMIHIHVLELIREKIDIRLKDVEDAIRKPSE